MSEQNKNLNYLLYFLLMNYCLKFLIEFHPVCGTLNFNLFLILNFLTLASIQPSPFTLPSSLSQAISCKPKIPKIGFLSIKTALFKGLIRFSF